MCQALCPGAKAKAYFKQGPKLDNAVGSDGKRYAALATAGLHKKQFDPQCTCKPQGQTGIPPCGGRASWQARKAMTPSSPTSRSGRPISRACAAAPALNNVRASAAPWPSTQMMIRCRWSAMHLMSGASCISRPSRRCSRPRAQPVEPEPAGKRPVRVVGPRSTRANPRSWAAEAPLTIAAGRPPAHQPPQFVHRTNSRAVR